MAHDLVFRPSAEADLVALFDYIADRAGNESASAFIGRIEAACRKLTTFPERGTVRNDIHPGLRVIGFERRTSMALIVQGNTVRILHILNGGRAFPDDWGNPEG